MEGAADILAFKIKGSSLRFLRLRSGVSPVELPSNTDVSYTRVGFAFDDDRQTFVLATKNGSSNFDIREARRETGLSSPRSWPMRARAVRGVNKKALRSSIWAMAFLRRSCWDRATTRSSSRISCSLWGAGLMRTVTAYGSPTTVTLQHSEPAIYEMDPFHGYANFRWAGTVTFNGTDLEMCASPRELNNVYNGDYSCGRTH